MASLIHNTLHRIRVIGSVATSTLSAWRGTSLVTAAAQPPLLLQLYDQEGSPDCRSVREALTALGLDVEIYPCPRGGRRYRAQAKKLGGVAQFPMLVDRNTQVVLRESGAIVNYLFQTYGQRATPPAYQPGTLRPLLGSLGSALRGLRGIQYRRAKPAKKLLELWSFESSPFTRLVRERLTELELAYIVHNIGKEQFADMGPAVMRVRPGPYKPRPGGRREKLLAQLGRVQVPYLEDPNTGVKLYESSAIMDYLEQQYACQNGR